MKGLNVKKELVMKRVLKNGTLALAALTALFLGCENFIEKQPFQAGLGRMVDLETPTFSLDSHGPNAFIRGVETFSGTAADDVEVREVQVSVKSGPFTAVAYDAASERWTMTLNLAAKDALGNAVFEDGPFTLQFRVWDNSGRTPLTTANYAFTVKNGFPSLELQIPAVNGSRTGTELWTGEETGFNDSKLNTAAGKKLTATPSNGSLIGIVTDLSGIHEDYPQIKFWPAYNDDLLATDRDDPDGPTSGDPGAALGADGEYYWSYGDTDPSPAQPGVILYGGWHKADVNPNDRAENSFTFTFPLLKYKEVGGQIRATEDPLPVGSYRFLFKVKDNLPGSEEIVYPVYVPAGSDYPNQYLELTLEAPAAAPDIALYDLGHPAETDPAHPAFTTNNAGALAATYRAPHRYIDDNTIANKNGLIFSDLSSPHTGATPFFTLRVKASHEDGIRYARLTVRKEGSAAEPETLYFAGGTPSTPAAGATIPAGGPGDPPARLFTYEPPWSYFTSNGDGTYYYTVTASSKSGVDATEVYTIRVDTVQPVTRINNILSSIKNETNEKIFTLNGQIKLQGLAYDSETGIRSGAGSVRWVFLKNTGLSPDAAAFRTALDADTAFMGDDSAWAKFRGDLSGSPFTSALINTANATMFPGGGGEYTLFLLSQDSAYNRFVDEYPVTIDQDSDLPVVEAVGMTAEATQAELENGDYPGNIFSSSSKFTIRLRDDDALNTGAGTGWGTVTVKITGNIKLDGTQATATLTLPAGGLTRTSENRAGFEITQTQLAAALYAASGSEFPPATALRDGYYELTVSVSDQQSAAESANSVPKTPATGTQTIFFAKNTADPRVNFANPVTGGYYQGLITVSGVLEDDGPIDTAYLKISLPANPAGGDWSSGPFVDALAAPGDGGYSATITPAGTNPDPVSGKYRYDFSIPGVNVGTLFTEEFRIGLEAQDVFGRKTANVQVIIKVDTDPPVIEIMESEFNHLTVMNGRENNVNGKVSFKAYIFDGESGLPAYASATAPRYWFLPAGDSAPSWTTSGYAVLGTPDAESRFGATIDTRSYNSPATGAYKLWVLAQDKAGVTGFNSFDLYLDQATDLPWLDFETLTPYRSVNYDPLNPGTEYTAGNPATYAVEAIADSGILISAVIYDDDGFNTSHTVDIQYWDGSGGEPAENAADVAPGWKVSGVNTVGGSLVSLTAFQFSFYLPTDTAESGFLGTGEGPRKYRYRIHDALPAGKLDDVTASTPWKQIYFILDRQAPEIIFDPVPPESNPQGSNFLKPADTGYATEAFIQGTVSEAYLNIFKYLDYSMYISPTQSINGRLTLTGNSPYSWKITYKELDDKLKAAGLAGGWYETAPGNGLPDQNYVVKFFVTDDSNSMTTRDWNFSKDSTGPVITFNVDASAAAANAAILKSVRPALKGSLRDANSLTPLDVLRPYYYRFDYTGAADSNPGDIANWSTGTAEGLGNNVNWEIDITNDADNTIPANRLEDGLHRLDIKAEDALHSWSKVYTGAATVYFKVDTTAPVVAYTPPLLPVYQVTNSASSTVVLEGTAGDNLFASISAEIGRAGAALLPLSSFPASSYRIEYKNTSNVWVTAPAWTTIGASRNVEWRITLTGTLLHHASLGADANFQDFVLRVTAHDEAGRTTWTEWNFRNDRQAPAYTLISAAAPDGALYLQEGSPRIQASFADASGVTEVTALVQKYTYSSGSWPAGNNGETRTLSSLGLNTGETVNWTLPLGSAGTGALGLTDGWYRLRLTPADAAGNTAAYPAANDWQYFYVDRNNPELTVASPAPSAILKDIVNGGNHYIEVTVDTQDGADGNRITRMRAKLVPKGTAEESIPWPLDTSEAVFRPGAYAISYHQTLKVATASFDANGYIPSGEYTLYVQAEDSGGRAAMADFSVTIDNSPPELEIESPYMGPAAGSTEVIGGVTYTRLHQPLEVFGERAFVGSARDNNTVKNLRYYLGQTPPAVGDSSQADWAATTPWRNAGFQGTNAADMTLWSGTYSWQLDFPNIDRFLPKLNPGSEYVNTVPYVGATQVDPLLTGSREIWRMPLYFRVEDSAGNVKLYVQDLWLDPDGSVPKTYIESHNDEALVGGAITVGGTATDDFGVYDISFRVWKLNAGGSRTGTVNLKQDGRYSAYAADNRTTTLGGDYAGGDWFRYSSSAEVSGLSPVSWSFIINNYGELNPPDGQAEQRIEVEVFAWDANAPNYAVQGDNHGVPDRVKLRFSNTAPVIENIEITTTSSAAYTNAPYTGGMKFTGGFSMEAHVWVSNSTEFNSISYQGAEMAAAHSFASVANGSYDMGNGAGTVTVGNPDYTKTGFTGKKITISGLDPEKLQGRNSGGTMNDPTWGQTRYKDKGAVYSLNLKVEDTMSPTHYYAEQRFEFRIDNFFPTAALTGTAAAAEPWLAGSSALLSGTFRDDDSSGSVSGGASGLQKVVVWFTRGGSGVPLDAATSAHTYTEEAATGRAGNAATSSTPIPLYPKITPNRVSYPDGAFQPEAFYSGVSIDFAGESTIDRDLDRCVEFFDPLSGAWSVRLNTENIGSGPITLNYAVFDEAGNGRYYSKDIVIRNKTPVISTVILYTDLYGKVASNETTPVYTPFTFDGNLENARNNPGTLLNTLDNSATGFTVRKKHLSFTVLVNGGNNNLNFRVNYKGAGTTVLETTSQTGVSLGAGGLTWRTLTFEGTVFDTMPDLDNGVFEITVWDNITGSGSETGQLSDTRTLGINLDNADTTPPQVLIHDLNPQLETGVEATLAATQTAVAQPLGIGSDYNRNLPGLYNRGTQAAPVPSGHIEPRIQSVLGGELGSPTFARDTVSGTVIIRGSAFDSHRVRDVNLGLNTGAGTYGTPVLQAVRDGSTSMWKLEAVSPASAWVYEEWRQDGHYVEWAYLWDSETLPAGLVVGASGLKAQARDAAPNSSANIDWNSGADPGNLRSAYHEYNNITVELAPFILEVQDASGGLHPRSTQGWYSLYREDSPAAIHTITGYNLKASGSSTLNIGDGHMGSPVNLTQTSPDKNRLTFRLAAATVSGKITLKTTGGAAVEAVNSRLEKINPWNLEQNTGAGREIWDHGSFAHIWRAREGDYFDGSNGGSDFAMAVHPGDAGLWASWVNRGAFRTYHSYYDNVNVSTKNTVYIMTSHDPQRETDVHINPTLHTGNIDVQGTGDSLSTNGVRRSGVTVAYMNLAAYTHDHSADDETGGIAVYDKRAPRYNRESLSGTAYAMENVYRSTDHVSTRFNRPRVVTHMVAGPTDGQSRVHVSYYDNISKQLRYASVTSNITTSTSIGNGAGTPTNQAVDGSAATENVGSWSAIDYLSGGQPIIAYYSDTRETVKLAYRDGTGAEWTAPREIMGWPYEAWNWGSLNANNKGAWLIANYGIVNGAPGTGNSGTTNAGNNNTARTNAWTAMSEAAREAYLKAEPDSWRTGTWLFADYIWPASVTSAGNRSDWLENNFGITGTDLGTTNNTTTRSNAWLNMTPAQRLDWLIARRDALIAPLYWDAANLIWPATSNFADATNQSTWLAQHYGVDLDAAGLGATSATKVASWNALTNDQRRVFLMEHQNSCTWAFANTSGGTGTWKIGDLLDSGDDYYQGSGLYVALRVDRKGAPSSDIIHVSFYNSRNNTLVYATGTVNSFVTGGNGGRGVFNFTSMEVDTSLSGGAWSDLSLDPQGNPWISYRDQAGFRVAHRNLSQFTKPSVDRLGHDNTGWDAARATIGFNVLDGRLNIETISNTLAANQGWNAAVGYPSDAYFRVAYRTPAAAAMTIPGWYE
ncbi:MAG: hypothetical protein LBK27_07355 [Treponema sp.]|jgi:hypothetical protein|nr:hypothetical protein [Treponema sp.]